MNIPMYSLTISLTTIFHRPWQDVGHWMTMTVGEWLLVTGGCWRQWILMCTMHVYIYIYIVWYAKLECKGSAKSRLLSGLLVENPISNSVCRPYRSDWIWTIIESSRWMLYYSEIYVIYLNQNVFFIECFNCGPDVSVCWLQGLIFGDHVISIWSPADRSPKWV